MPGLKLIHFDKEVPEQIDLHFADDIFKCIFMNETVCVRFPILVKFVRKGVIIPPASTKLKGGYTGIDLARNGNSGCANEILGCVKCQFWWKSPWKWKN